MEALFLNREMHIENHLNTINQLHVQDKWWLLKAGFFVVLVSVIFF